MILNPEYDAVIGKGEIIGAVSEKERSVLHGDVHLFHRSHDSVVISDPFHSFNLLSYLCFRFRSEVLRLS